MPALTVALVTAPDPEGPVIEVGPVAVSVQLAGTAVPPVAPLVTTFTSVNVAGTSSLVKVHTPDWPDVRVTTAVRVVACSLTTQSIGHRVAGRTGLAQACTAARDGR